MDRRFAWLFLLVTSYLLTCASDKPCAELHFTGLIGGVFHVAENETGSFEFQLTNNCTRRVVLKISKKTKNAYDVYCMFRLNDTSVHCSDVSVIAKDKYKVQRIFHRSDSTTWKWWSSPEWALESKEVAFNILYPSCVSSLQIQGESSHHVVKQNTSVTIVCHWEQGNPTVKARLFVRDGRELKPVVQAKGQMSYTFPSVGCDDAGSVSCEAPNSIRNQSARLLVQCPPKLHLTENITIAVEGKSTEISVLMRAHSTDVANCQLAQIVTHHSGVLGSTTRKSKSCLRDISVTGTPPDLVLTARLDNVKKQDEGQWTLTLTNDAGPGHLVFNLGVNSFPIQAENDGIQSTTEDTNTQEYRFGKIPTQFEDGVPAERTTYIIVGANVVGFAVLAAFVITLNLIYIRRGRRSNRMSVEMHQISELNAPHRPGTLYSEGSNFYEEIADGVLPLNLGARPSAPVCQRTEPESGVIPVRIPTAPSAHVIAVSTDSGPSTTGDYMDMGQGVISVPREDNLQLLDHDSDEYMDMSEGIKSDNRTEQLSRLYENIPH